MLTRSFFFPLIEHFFQYLQVDIIIDLCSKVAHKIDFLLSTMYRIITVVFYRVLHGKSLIVSSFLILRDENFQLVVREL